MRSTIRALIVANDYLETEVGELMKAVSHAYVRGRFHTYSGQVNSGLFKPTRPPSHRPIFEIHNPVWGRATDEFSDKSAPDIVLLNRAKTSRNQTP
jgi:hypothetical protein